MPKINQEEYESSLNIATPWTPNPIDYESEEKEVKDLEWMKVKLKKDHKDGEMARSQIKDGEKIDGIDLNSYWRGRQTANYIARCYLEDLDQETLSQEKVQIPWLVYKWIEHQKMFDFTIYDLLSLASKGKWATESVNKFINENGELFIKAWLAYPNIEIEQEPKYYVLDKEGHLLIRNFSNGEIGRAGDKMTPDKYPDWNKKNLTLTEQEIKDYDPRYWAFAEPVEGCMNEI